MTDSGRVLLVPEGHLKGPGTCASTRSSPGFADPQLWYDFVGNIYFCTTCTEAIGSVMGMLPFADVKALKIRLSKYADRVQEQAHKIRELEADNAALRRVSSMSNHPASSPVSSGTEDATSNAGSDDYGVTIPSYEPDADEPVVAEPVKGKRPRNTRAPANDDITAALGI